MLRIDLALFLGPHVCLAYLLSDMPKFLGGALKTLFYIAERTAGGG